MLEKNITILHFPYIDFTIWLWMDCDDKFQLYPTLPVCYPNSTFKLAPTTCMNLFGRTGPVFFGLFTKIKNRL